ncbi:hypothetical protein [Paenibacillus pedocola]|uniref:hypothetical protein n=1 Tax=Paenibacillus pedocola TaxID=3242193 RepID=UPI0028772849|nr:hypothetical protein [Paenibacillus typhae]
MFNKASTVMKIIISFTLVVIIVPLLLNFIPIRLAIELDDAQQNLGIGRYICITDYKEKVAVDTEWFAQADNNSHLDRTSAVRVSGDSPDRYLSEKEFGSFDSENTFLLIGNIDRFEEDKGGYFLNSYLNVDKWKIIYPIERESIRKYFTSKSYLNIYDFDLMKIMKNLWR